MTQLKKCIAINAAAFLGLACACSLVFAAGAAGTVVNLSGPLLAKKANGAVKVLALKSEVEEGDTLVSERNTYAQVRFIDNSTVTLRPGTTFAIEEFAFDEAKPEGDHATFNLVRGGVRSVAGQIGKRSNGKFALKTSSVTIGVHGATFIAEYVELDAQRMASLQEWLMASTAGLDGAGMPIAPLQLAQANPPTKPPALPAGLYVSVIDGAIIMSNRGGTQNFTAGQFGYTGSIVQPPVVVPANPGLKFTPPPAFNAAATTGGSSTSKANTVDCEVR